MANLAEKIEYLLQDVDLSSAVEIRDEGDGMFIKWWNKDIAKREQPTQDELDNIDQDVDEWLSLKNRPTQISFREFWLLLSFPKRVAARNLAQALQNNPENPDSTLMMVYEETLTDSVLDLTDSGQQALLTNIAAALKSAKILTNQDVQDWTDLKPVA